MCRKQGFIQSLTMNILNEAGDDAKVCLLRHLVCTATVSYGGFVENYQNRHVIIVEVIACQVDPGMVEFSMLAVLKNIASNGKI